MESSLDKQLFFEEVNTNYKEMNNKIKQLETKITKLKIDWKKTEADKIDVNAKAQHAILDHGVDSKEYRQALEEENKIEAEQQKITDELTKLKDEVDARKKIIDEKVEMAKKDPDISRAMYVSLEKEYTKEAKKAKTALNKNTKEKKEIDSVKELKGKDEGFKNKIDELEATIALHKARKTMDTKEAKLEIVKLKREIKNIAAKNKVDISDEFFKGYDTLNNKEENNKKEQEKLTKDSNKYTKAAEIAKNKITELDTPQQAMVPIQEKPKWYQFVQRFRNWRNRNQEPEPVEPPKPAASQDNEFQKKMEQWGNQNRAVSKEIQRRESEKIFEEIEQQTQPNDERDDEGR